MLRGVILELRKERQRWWRGRIPTLWQENPKAVYRWLAAVPLAWGTVPILTASGVQCTTTPEVDGVVRGFWVDRVWCMHAEVDGEVKWAEFVHSEFFPHVPQCTWPHSPWSAERVKKVVSSLRDGSAPGVRGIPIAVWKNLPELYLELVAAMLNQVEESGVWPKELLHAYVAMIPKASGGSRPQDQRPITVLDVVYRVWSKGTITEWGPTLNQSYLGQAAMGFRAQTGTLHVAQLLSDLIALQKWRGKELWLVSFDVEKCFPSLPWWAVFGVMQHAGVHPHTVRAFRVYNSLRHRFRYGQVDGAEWSMANGLAQGCPASPDLLNMLFEAFHRWAADQHGRGGCGTARGLSEFRR